MKCVFEEDLTSQTIENGQDLRKKNLFIIKNGKTCYCNSIDEYRVLTVIDAVVYTVVLPKKESDVEVFVQIRFIFL